MNTCVACRPATQGQHALQDWSTKIKNLAMDHDPWATGDCMLVFITTPYLGGGVWGGLEIGEFPIKGWGVGVGGEWVDGRL